MFLSVSILFFLLSDIMHDFCISPSSGETIRYISLIFHWYITGETPNIYLTFLLNTIINNLLTLLILSDF